MEGKKSGDNLPKGEAPQTKILHNRNDYKVEVVIGNEVVVLGPHASVDVPMDYKAPTSLGLYTK